MYDYIFIGTSAPMLYYINYLFEKNKLCCTDNILIIEQNKSKIGGSWYSISNEFCHQVDHAIHFIPLYNNSDLIIQKLKRFNLDVDIIDSNNLIIEYEPYKVFNDNGLLYSKKGWFHLINTLYQNIISRDNVKIMFDKVNDIIITKNKINIKSKNNYESKKIFIPAYIDLKYIYFNNTILYLNNDYDKKEQVNTLHLLLYIKTNKIKYDENFHAIYDDIDIFDRVMFVANSNHMVSDKLNLIAILRVSRSYKNKIHDIHNIEDKAYNFLYEKDLIYESSVIGFEITEYKYYYRYNSFEKNKNIINNTLIKNNINNNILEIVDTRDLGNTINLFN